MAPAGAGRRPRVFCASLADWLDPEVPIEWLADLLDLIRCTPNLDWLLLTKRPENFAELVYEAADRSTNEELFTWGTDWVRGGAPENVWIGTSIENQKYADIRIPALLKIPAGVRFLSCEPLLGPLDLAYTCFNGADSFGQMPGISWCIVGGESGPNKRPINCDWARSIRDQCRVAGVPFFMKQVDKIRAIPEDLMIREFPTQPDVTP